MYGYLVNEKQERLGKVSSVVGMLWHLWRAGGRAWSRARKVALQQSSSG